jgi:TonB family protein
MLQDVLRNDPANVGARETMGYIAFRQHNFDQARRWCQEAIKLDPNSFVAHYFFGAASTRKGTPDRASQAAVEESLRAAIKINPSFAPAYDALAIFYSSRGVNLTEAYDLIEKAVQLGPGVPEIRIDESAVLSSMNKTKEAVEVLQLAMKMSHTPEQVAAAENVLENVRKFDAERAKMSAQNKASVPTRIGAPAPAGDTPPRPLDSREIEYTEEARAAKLQGTCVVQMLVGVDGKATNIVVTKKVGYGMDERAVEAVSKWKFEPGRHNGKPVPSRLNLSLSFKLFGTDTQKFMDLSEKPVPAIPPPNSN